jgi:fermentation-respiration switch protein FrsA (DUF1100 family)
VLDRHRVMDRLNDLRLVPWGEADGDGAAIFRLAAAKAACGRLVDATPEIAVHPMPELLVAAGGVFPQCLHRWWPWLGRSRSAPGVSQLASDQARLLGPLGVIEDEAERRSSWPTWPTTS